MIKRFDSINEEFLGIDFKKIKDLTYEWYLMTPDEKKDYLDKSNDWDIISQS